MYSNIENNVHMQLNLRKYARKEINIPHQSSSCKTSNVTGRHRGPKSKLSGWCCMCSTFLKILSIFSSPEGSRLQCFIPVDILHIQSITVLANTAVLSMYACMYCLFSDTWYPLVSFITTLYYVAISFHRRVWYHALSLCYACIQSSDIILIP